MYAMPPERAAELAALRWQDAGYNHGVRDHYAQDFLTDAQLALAPAPFAAGYHQAIAERAS